MVVAAVSVSASRAALEISLGACHVRLGVLGQVLYVAGLVVGLLGKVCVERPLDHGPRPLPVGHLALGRRQFHPLAHLRGTSELDECF